MRIKLLFLLICLGSISLICGMNKIANEMLKEGFLMDDVELMKEAIESGADVNTQYNGVPVLLRAVRCQSKRPIVELLLAYKANPNIADNSGISHHSGETPILAAVRHGNEDILKLLLDYGADPDIENQDQTSYTALISAMYYTSRGVVKLLLDAGSSLDIRNKWNLTALDIARIYKNTDFIELIKEEYKKREEKRQQVNKEIVESGCLLPDLASIVSEYAVCAKQKGGGK